MTRRAGIALLAAVALAAAAAPWIAPHRTDESFPGLLNAPPTRVRRPRCQFRSTHRPRRRRRWAR